MTQLNKDLSNLPDIVSKYEDELKEVESHLALKGKSIEAANRDQAVWPNYYDQRRAELKSLVATLELRAARVRGELTRKFKENHSRDLGERLLNSYIDNEQAYISAQEFVILMTELYDKYAAVLEAFTKRGYALKNITLARVHQFENNLM